MNTDYGFIHNETVYTPNQTTVTPDHNKARNAVIDAYQLAQWRQCPDRIVAYYKFADGCRADSLHLYSARTLADCIVTTWMGAKLGTIVRANVYRHNFGGRFVSITVIGTNGAMYHGRASYENGSCICLHRSRE